jgi:hypothetical protein
MFPESPEGQDSLASRIKDILIMKPKPSPYPLIRIGGDQDGAYLIPDDLKGIGACFSPGVNNTKRFEDDLTTNHGIPCHLCDFTSDLEEFETPLIKGMQTFQKKWLDADPGENSISLDSWIGEQCSAEEGDLLLQMDIEGAEYKNLLACKQNTLERLRIITIELHKLDMVNDPEKIELELGPLLRRLDQSHICVHAHPNNCCGEFRMEGTHLFIPRVIELTFLRRDRLSQEQAGKLYAPLLPHPLDLACNVIEKPPLLLEGDWLSERTHGSESQEALSDWKRVSMLSRKLAFSEERVEQLEFDQKQTNQQLDKATQRLEALEKRLGEIERFIQVYLWIKARIKGPNRWGKAQSTPTRSKA